MVPKMRPGGWIALVLVPLVFGCAGDTTGGDDDSADPEPIHLDADEACENINPGYCMLPWPSSRYLAPDDTTETGWRVAYESETFPTNIEDLAFDPTPYNRLDGFPPSSQILTVFDAPVDGSVLPPHWDYDRSLAADSPTVLLDMDRGERVAHFAEFDVRFEDPAEILLYIRPAQRLAEDTRYAVAIRGLEYDAGGEVPASPAFAALRDGVPTDAPTVEQRRGSLDEVFAALEAAGIERGSLIQAWDFRTASGAALWGDLLHMRDDAMARVGAQGLGCTVTRVDEEVDDVTFRYIEGTYTVPLYMDSPYPGARLVYGDDGLPGYQGDHEVDFFAVIPRSLAEEGADPGRLLTYGHGFFLGGSQVADPWQAGLANDLGFVMVGTHWAGMSDDDIVVAASLLSDLNGFPKLTERLMQGVINQLVLTRTMAGVCALDESFEVNGQTAFDPEQRYFLGISLGSIMGATTLSLSQDIDRAVLHVGGNVLPMMEARSINFEQFETVYSGWYPSRIDREFYWSVFGHLWEKAEPVTFLPHLIDDPLEGTQPKSVLYQIALNDAEVPNIASDAAGRTAGFELLTPTPHEVWGMEDAPATPYEGSAMIYWDCGDPDVPLGNEPPEDNSAHQCVRRTESFLTQLDSFLRPGGVVVHPCDGACDPE